MAAEDAAKDIDRSRTRRTNPEQQNGGAYSARTEHEPNAASSIPFANAEQSMQRLMERLAGPLRSLLDGQRLSDKAKKELVEALTQFETDTDRLATAVDVEQLHQDMQAAFEEFHTALKRIFRITTDEDPATMPMTGRTSSQNRERLSLDPAAGSQIEGAGSPRATGKGQPTPPDELLRRIATTYRHVLLGDPADIPTTAADEESVGSSVPTEDEAYRRFASMYTALYPQGGGRASINTES